MEGSRICSSQQKLFCFFHSLPIKQSLFPNNHASNQGAEALILCKSPVMCREGWLRHGLLHPDHRHPTYPAWSQAAAAPTALPPSSRGCCGELGLRVCAGALLGASHLLTCPNAEGGVGGGWMEGWRDGLMKLHKTTRRNHCPSVCRTCVAQYVIGMKIFFAGSMEKNMSVENLS